MGGNDLHLQHTCLDRHTVLPGMMVTLGVIAADVWDMVVLVAVGADV